MSGCEHAISLWSGTSRPARFEKLEQDIATDILIIGGGLAGILCAYCLKQAGADYVLAEADEICSGMTKNTTAKITSQHGLIYHTLLRRFGLEKTRLYYEANERALSAYRALCGDMDCDFEEKDHCVYSLSSRGSIKAEMEALGRIGCAAWEIDCAPLPFSVAGGVKFPRQAQFHPLKFVGAIARDLNIYEHTKVREIEGLTAVTDGGRIAAKKVIIATHFPIANKHGLYFLKLYQHRSYVMALEGAPDLNGMYVDAEKDGFSFRNANGLLLIGGGGHRTGKQGGNWNELESFARKYYPDAKCRYRWAAQDCMSLDDIPYIGQYAAGTPDLYVATGFNK